MTEIDLKKLFARQWLKTNNPGKAAAEIFGDDTVTYIQVAATWISDPLVLSEKERIIQDEPEENYMPSKYDACMLAWDVANNGKAYLEDRFKFLKLYADMRGLIPKGNQVNVNVDNSTNTSNRVMIIEKPAGKSWEIAARTQQKQLIEKNAQYFEDADD